MSNTKAIGRPRVTITPEIVLNAYASYHSIRHAARSLGITSGVAFARLKEAGVCPLGMTPKEAGQLGQKCRKINQGVQK